MRYTDVCIEAMTHVLPSRVITSAMIEKWLKPVYDRLHLPEGRLELMTGIRERRFWADGMYPSQAAAEAGRRALAAAGVEPATVGCLLHCSVSRDYLEPATSTAVHRLLEMPAHALNFDISNACLGLLSGMVMVANMIQLGQIESGLVVGGETAESLVQATIEQLNADTTLTRRSIKPHVASLTIGSGAAAILLTHRERSRFGHLLIGGGPAADTRYNHLCQGDTDGGMGGPHRPLMQTDSPELLRQGVAVARRTWEQTKAVLNWDNDTPDVICTHQVGRAHRLELYSALGLDAGRDFSTFSRLGNCGSVSLPMAVSMAIEEGRIEAGQRVALLGIGSGINCAMLGVAW